MITIKKHFNKKYMKHINSNKRCIFCNELKHNVIIIKRIKFSIYLCNDCYSKYLDGVINPELLIKIIEIMELNKEIRKTYVQYY